MSLLNLYHRIAAYYRYALVEGSFAHNVLVMFVGTFLGQFVSVLLSPILTRIYSPDMFGTLGIFSAVVSIFCVIASLRYEMALPLVESDDDAANLLAVCIVSLFLTTAFCFLVVLIISVLGGNIVSLGIITPYRWLLPIGFFCIGSYQMMIYYATRQQAFREISRTKIFQGVVGPLTQIVMGLVSVSPWGLIIGFIAGQATGVKLLFTRLVNEPKVLSKVSFVGMKEMAIRFRRFLLVSSWSGIMETTGSSYLLLVTIPLLYSTTIAGFVFLTDRIIGRPLLLVSTSILQVYVGDVGKTLKQNPAAIRPRFLRLAVRQFMIVACWLLIVNVLASYAIPIIFGHEWEGAVPYLHVLSIAYLPQMIVHALAHTLQVMEKQGLSAIWEACRLTALIGVFVASYEYGLDALHALLAYSTVQAIAQIILFILMYQSVKSLENVVPDAQI